MKGPAESVTPARWTWALIQYAARCAVFHGSEALHRCGGRRVVRILADGPPPREMLAERLEETMKNSPFRITRMDLLVDARWLRLFRLHYRTRSGAERSWVMATRLKAPRCANGRFDRPDAVVIAAYHVGRSKIVVTREYRVALGDYEYGFPAGLVDEGETVAEAARRELKEETGLDVVRFMRESPPVYSTAGMTDESVSIVYVECDGEPSAEANHDSEVIDVLFASPDEAGRLCNDLSLKFDAKAWLVLDHFAKTGSM